MSTSSLSKASESQSLPNSLTNWLLHLIDCDVRAISSMIILFLMVFINGADFQGADPDRLTINWQIYLRLAVCGIAGCYATWHISSAYRVLHQFPGALALLYGLWVLVTVPFSMDVRYSAVAGISLMTAILFVPVAIIQLGKYRFIVTTFFGTAAYTAASWVVYLVFPELGVWREFLSMDESIDRMGGLGHPNGLGFFVSAGFVLAIVLWHDHRIRWIELVVVGVIWLVTIYLCLSRTSMVVAVVASAAVMIHRFRTPQGVRLLGIAFLVIGLAGMYLGFTGDLDRLAHGLLLSVSKSGEVSELTTATGRSEIWVYSIEQIFERPVTGCGYGCARFVMDEHSYHAHNIILNAGLTTGIVGGLLVAAMIGVILLRLLNQPDAYVRGVATIFLVGGLVESMIYDPCPNLAAVLFLSIVFWERDTDPKGSTATDSQLP